MANATRRRLREKSRSPKKSHSRKGVKRYGRIPLHVQSYERAARRAFHTRVQGLQHFFSALEGASVLLGSRTAPPWHHRRQYRLQPCHLQSAAPGRVLWLYHLSSFRCHHRSRPAHTRARPHLHQVRRKRSCSRSPWLKERPLNVCRRM